MKNLREEMPWNYCDYRCEVCLYQATCKVFHAVQVEQQIAVAEGKDPDSMEFVLESVGRTLADVGVSLEEELQKRGIDLDAVTEEAKRRPWRERRDPLARQALDLAVRTLKFIRQSRPAAIQEPSLAQAWDNLEWYAPLAGAKIGRALAGLEDAEDGDPEWGVPDYSVSAGIALKSIRECLGALAALEGAVPAADGEIRELRAEFAKVREIIRERFAQRM